MLRIPACWVAERAATKLLVPVEVILAAFGTAQGDGIGSMKATGERFACPLCFVCISWLSKAIVGTFTWLLFVSLLQLCARVALAPVRGVRWGPALAGAALPRTEVTLAIQKPHLGSLSPDGSLPGPGGALLMPVPPHSSPASGFGGVSPTCLGPTSS